jgi:hypothetical protein
VVVERDDDKPSPLTAAEASRYAYEIAFLDYFRDSAAAAFARFRTRTVGVVGTGPLLPAVVGAALRTGLRTVHVVITENPDTGAPYTAGEALARLGCGQLCTPEAYTTYPFTTDRTQRSASQPVTSGS